VPADRDVGAFVRAVQDAEVALVALNFFAGDMPGGDRGLVSWPARSTQFRDNLDVPLGSAARCSSTADLLDRLRRPARRAGRCVGGRVSGLAAITDGATGERQRSLRAT
jgi:hypothetical protein